MNTLWAILVTLNYFWAPGTPERWLVNSESQIMIQGSTNIGSYSCSLEKIYSAEPLLCTPAADKLLFGPNRLALPVEDFECNNFLVDNDFQELLRAKQHKNIWVGLIELDRPEPANAAITGKVRITIINREKVYTVNFRSKKTEHGELILSGRVNLPFSDFDLTPPKRFGGLVKIDETISVNFKLRIEKQVALAQ